MCQFKPTALYLKISFLINLYLKFKHNATIIITETRKSPHLQCLTWEQITTVLLGHLPRNSANSRQQVWPNVRVDAENEQSLDCQSSTDHRMVVPNSPPVERLATNESNSSDSASIGCNGCGVRQYIAPCLAPEHVHGAKTSATTLPI